MSIALHKLILRDATRMRAYSSAIKRVTRSGDTVIDLGCGTGIMGFLALKNGAKKVYAIESGEIIYLAKYLAYENGLAERAVFIHRNSTKAKIPERADLLITELMSDFGIVGEGIIPTVCDAKKRLLKRSARIIPSKLTMMLCPVSSGSVYSREVVWDNIQGIKVGYLGKLAQNEIVEIRQERIRHLAKVGKLYTVDFAMITSAPEIISCETLFSITRNGIFHGLKVWFVAELARGILLDSSKGTHWRPFLLPVHQPKRLKIGDRVTAKLIIGRSYS